MIKRTINTIEIQRDESILNISNGNGSVPTNLSSSLSGKSDFEALIYNIDNVWALIQGEIQSLLCVHLQAMPSINDGVSPMDMMSQHESSLFSFSDSAMSMNTIEESSQAFGSIGPLFKASPYNITSIASNVITFNQKISEITRLRGEKALQLKTFVEDFIQENFLHQIEADYSKRVTSTIEGMEAFKPREKCTKGIYSVDEASRPLLQSSIEMSKILKELMYVVVSIPQHMNKVVKIVEKSLLRYWDKCNSKYEEILYETHTKTRLENAEVLQVLSSDPLWKMVQSKSAPRIQSAMKRTNPTQFSSSQTGVPNSSIPSPSNLSSTSATSVTPGVQLGTNSIQSSPVLFSITAKNDNEETEEQLIFYDEEERLESLQFSQEKPTKTKLITDIPKIALLAQMNDSLEWIAQKIETVGVKPASRAKAKLGILSSKSAKISDKSSERGDEEKQVSSGIRIKIGGEEKEKGDKRENEKTLATAKPALEALSFKFRTLAERCLFALRLEFRIHCMLSLEKIQNSSYYIEEAQEPDNFILELNKDLSASEECMSTFLPSHKIRYLFDGLPRLISTILIRSLKKIKRMNRIGVQKMIRNVLALQQNLTNIASNASKEHYFERARKYFELLNLPEDEIISLLSEDRLRVQFSVDEFKSLLEFKQPDKKLPEKLAAQIQTLFESRTPNSQTNHSSN